MFIIKSEWRYIRKSLTCEKREIATPKRVWKFPGLMQRFSERFRVRMTILNHSRVEENRYDGFRVL